MGLLEHGAPSHESTAEGPISTAINASITVDTSDPSVLLRNMPSFCHVSVETRAKDATMNDRHMGDRARMPWSRFDDNMAGQDVHTVGKVAEMIHDKWHAMNPPDRGVRPPHVSFRTVSMDVYHFIGIQIGEPLTSSRQSGLIKRCRSLPYDTVAFTFGKHAQVYNMWTHCDGTQAAIFDLLFICVMYDQTDDHMFLWPVDVEGAHKVHSLKGMRPSNAQMKKRGTVQHVGRSIIKHYWFVGTLLSEVTVHVRGEDVAAVLSVDRDVEREHPDRCGMVLVDINTRF